MTTQAPQDAPTYEVKFDSEFGVWMVYTFDQDGRDEIHASLVALRDTEAEAHEVAAYFKSLDTSTTHISDALRAALKREEVKGGEVLMHLHRLLWRYGVGNEAPKEPPVYGPEW